MNIWGSKQLRRMALPLAVVSLGAALTMGWGQSFASGAPTTSASTDQSDPEVAVQSITFVLVPRDNDNFRPENACGGSPSVNNKVTPPVENPNAFGTGVGLLRNLSIGPSRCTLAVFQPTIHQGKDLFYSSTPCPVTTSGATAPNLSLKFVGLHTPDKLKPCTAGVFLSTLDGASKTTPDVRNNSLTKAQSAANRIALHDWAGDSCKPGPCTLFAEMVQQEGDFNSPGLCTSAFYITGPCTVAVLTTSDVNGPVFTPGPCTGTTNATCPVTTPAAPLVPATPNSGVPTFTPGGKVLNFTDGSCPISTSLSNRGDVQQGCTNLPFKPADMSFSLPPAATPPNEVLDPCVLPFVPGDTCGPAKHSPEVATQSLTIDVSPQGQDEFDPANACSIPGDTLASLVVTRCTAAIIKLPVGFAGGDVQIPTSRCTFDLSNAKGHGNNQGQPCFAEPFSPSKGNTIIHNMPAVTCRQPLPALVPGTAVAGTVLPVVPCNLVVTLTHEDGDFNAENPCGNLNTVIAPATVTPGITSTCLLASFNTDGHQQGDTLTATASTPVCPAANGTAPVFDADIHDTCVA
ncbi:MAG TPA: hypothetical protein VH134_03735, partial [Candidatus Dormibacteraeota bacterium]|nr:hypothetical protein [Candidatus Dormibacteraeota bacterium]